MTEAMWRIAAVPRMPRLFLPALVLVVFCAHGRTQPAAPRATRASIFNRNWRRHDEEIFEAESSFPATDAEALRALGWKVDLVEAARHRGEFWRHQRARIDARERLHRLC